jgi:hypothetical protein
MDIADSQPSIPDATSAALTDEQVTAMLTNVAPKHPALRRVHQKLNGEGGIRTEATISSYDRMHHRHNRS